MPTRAERLLHSLAQRDADILRRVVVIDVEIADGFDRDVDPRMAGEQIQHVVKKADAGCNLRHTGAIEVDRDLDVRFLGLALDARRAHEKLSASRMIRLRQSVSGWQQDHAPSNDLSASDTKSVSF